MREFSSQLFSFRENNFSAEASDLAFPAGVSMREFGIRSAVTGAVVRFELVGARRDECGYVQTWNYISEWLPSIKIRLTATVFND